MKKQTLQEWLTEAEERFGADKKQWEFKCPACERVSSVQDFLDEDADPNSVYQQCIGRVNGKGSTDQKDVGYGCNWASYGLFGTLGKGRKVLNDGEEVEVFNFPNHEVVTS
ncbi:VVA0879 family protein [Geomicrobium sp. JCM 19039]|uniref:VVA0879 family protein n=1 Tax=Geomicrobium sp. JCM 19039 TaxID=1460636 RepID=UPI0005AB84E0|nr:VVA0879 family protein [Geomicrobium sp. JCM 19039]